MGLLHFLKNNVMKPFRLNMHDFWRVAVPFTLAGPPLYFTGALVNSAVHQ